jgi:uncharacterized protein
VTRRSRLLFGVAVLDALIIALLWRDLVGPSHRVIDEVGLLSPQVRRVYDQHLEWVHQESGVDVRILLAPDAGGIPIEAFALASMRKLGVGRETGGRGLLIVVDTLDRAIRIEVGPKLEGILPDGFISFLMREHLRIFLEGGQPELGLRTTLFMIQWRIRMALLGEEYDPAVEEYVRDVRRLAAGGGASTRVTRDARLAGFINIEGDSAARAYFRPQPTVEGSYRRYEEWLVLGGGQMDIPLYTSESQRYLKGLPITPAFNAYILATEYGRAYSIEERGDLALLYYTDDPFLSPKFFRRTGDGWQMDVVAEVANSQETVGLPYTWRLRVSGDEYSTAFADLYTPLVVPSLDDYYRVIGGDNRPLQTRGTADPVESELAPRPRGRPRQPLPDASEYLTVRQAAERIRRSRGTRAIVILYNLPGTPVLDLPRMVASARACRERGIDVLALYADKVPPAALDLPALLRGQDAPFPPVRIHPWRSGMLDATMGELGIHVGMQWQAPLVAAIDAAGDVVGQGQGVADWEGIRALCEA